MEKAFDSVWIHRLIYTLKEKGVVGELFAMLNLFSIAYEKQIAFILIDEHNNFDFKSEIGLRQISVLSPVLFIIYIDDFLKN